MHRLDRVTVRVSVSNRVRGVFRLNGSQRECSGGFSGQMSYTPAITRLHESYITAQPITVVVYWVSRLTGPYITEGASWRTSVITMLFSSLSQ